MKYWKAAILFTIAILIQASLLNLVSIGGVTPNLLLCLVVVFSFLYEDELYGIIFGAVFGVAYDICFSSVTGYTAIALVLTSLMILIVREYANIENIINLWLVSVISLFLYYFVEWGLLHLAGNPLGIVPMLKILPWTGLYSIAVITCIYLVLIRKVIRYRKDRYFR